MNASSIKIAKEKHDKAVVRRKAREYITAYTCAYKFTVIYERKSNKTKNEYRGPIETMSQKEFPKKKT